MLFRVDSNLSRKEREVTQDASGPTLPNLVFFARYVIYASYYVDSSFLILQSTTIFPKMEWKKPDNFRYISWILFSAE
jgi:hypothetical protein